MNMKKLMKTRDKLFSILLVVAVVAALSAGFNNGSIIAKAEGEDPYFVMECISDLHHADNYVTSTTSGVRPNVQKVVNTMKEVDGDSIDAVIVGGDVTSGATTTESNLYRLLGLIEDKMLELTPNTFWITGNHDYNAGEENFNSADYYFRFVEPNAGPVETDDDIYIEEYNGKEYVCGYHYTINGCEIICLSNPYYTLAGTLQSSNYVYTDGTFEWLDATLFRVTEDPYRPVFIVGHYPLRDSNFINRPDKGLSVECDEKMKDILSFYDNIYYLYGHDHGRSDRAWIHEKTEQRVTEYDDHWNILNPENPPEGDVEYGEKKFTTIFMGSMNYYDANFNGVGITQALTVYVYEDRVEFAMKNYDTNDGGSYEIEPYISERTIRPTPAPTAEPTPEPGPQTGNNGTGTGNDQGQTPVNNQGQTAQNTQAQNTQTAPAVQTPAAQTTLKKAAVSSFKVKKNGKNAVVKIKKLDGAEGYQVSIATDKKFKKKAVADKSTKSLQLKIKKLKKSKQYYVRVRGYKTVDGKKTYGAWSAAKKAKIG